MVIAMIAMRVMQVAVDQVIDVIAVGHGLVSAAWAMHVTGLMTSAAVCGCAGGRIGV
jgi:hypothetical protein